MCMTLLEIAFEETLEETIEHISSDELNFGSASTRIVFTMCMYMHRFNLVYIEGG